jgi:putative endonuclease
MHNQKLGKNGEDLAAAYLESKGYRILARNYRFMRAEVDLVCHEPADPASGGGQIVFVEVKTRSSDRFGTPESAVDGNKQKNLLRAARSYLYEHRLEGAICRFDVVAVDWSGQEPGIEHVEGAFQA